MPIHMPLVAGASKSIEFGTCVRDLMTTRLITALTLLALLLPTHARAQTAWKDNGWVSVDFGSQGAPKSFVLSSTEQVNVETARLDVSYPFKSTSLIYAGGGYRLWRNLGAGATFSYTTQTGDA